MKPEKEKNEDILICRCEEVTRKEIEKAIEEGAETIKGVRIRTRAGMGLCQGRTCQDLVRKIIAEKTGKQVDELSPSTSRPPVRPVRIDVLRREEGE